MRGTEQPTFTVATDERLIDMINSAVDRIVVVAPALTSPIAHSIASRCKDESLSVTVILDADPEVYRMGYGDQEALELLRRAMTDNGLGLGCQPGVRIGMVIADERMVIFSPVPKLIEAGSSIEVKPNAIMLGGEAVERAVQAAGGGRTSGEIGKQAVSPTEIEKIEKNLGDDPPQKFDIARAVRVFSSQAEFVELKIENLRLATKSIRLPQELIGIRSEGLKSRITGNIRAPADITGPFELNLEHEDASFKGVKVGAQWVTDERREIENRFTFVVPKHGRVILTKEKQAFQAAIARFERNSALYKHAVQTEMTKHRESFKESLVEEYLPGWLDHPPFLITRFDPTPSKENIRRALENLIEDLLDESFLIEPIQCSIVYKGITWASANDKDFVSALTGAMRKRGVPKAEIDKLFRQFDAAEGTGNTLL